MSRPLGNETIEIVRAPLVRSARDNSENRDWNNPERWTIYEANVQPFILSEKLLVEVSGEREFLKQVWRVWVPAGSDVTYTDRCIWRCQEYDVLGINGIWNHIMGPEHHRDFMIRLREG